MERETPREKERWIKASEQSGKERRERKKAAEGAEEVVK